MLIGGDDISNDVITLGVCFSMFFYTPLISALRWLAEIWQLIWRGATGELEVEFKFQRSSWREVVREVVFLPRHQSALESLLAG